MNQLLLKHCWFFRMPKRCRENEFQPKNKPIPLFWRFWLDRMPWLKRISGSFWIVYSPLYQYRSGIVCEFTEARKIDSHPLTESNGILTDRTSTGKDDLQPSQGGCWSYSRNVARWFQTFFVFTPIYLGKMSISTNWPPKSCSEFCLKKLAHTLLSTSVADIFNPKWLLWVRYYGSLTYHTPRGPLAVVATDLWMDVF